MSRRHATVISLFLALALVLGAAAVLRTARLGGADAAASPSLAAANARLDRYEAQLRAAARTRPPALPAAGGKAQPPQRVVYVRAQQPRAEREHDDGDEHEHADRAHDHHDDDDD